MFKRVINVQIVLDLKDRIEFFERLSLEHLKMLFQKVSTKSERNTKIIEAIELGYSQNQIAKVLEVTQGTISHVLRQSRA